MDEPLPRTCFKRDGTPKKPYATFDEAQKSLDFQWRKKRMNAYRCPIHGWHVGHRFGSLREREAS